MVPFLTAGCCNMYSKPPKDEWRILELIPFLSLSIQASLMSSSFEHPELMDEVIYRIQVLRLMKRFMQACLVTDFRLEDLMAPGELITAIEMNDFLPPPPPHTHTTDSKRLCRNLR